MSSDETPKIEPTLIDAPSIAPETKPEADRTAKRPRLPRSRQRLRSRSNPNPSRRRSSPRSKPKPKRRPCRPLRRSSRRRRSSCAGVSPGPRKLRRSRASARFALLAACVAIAASLGAIGGSLGVANFGLMTAPKAEPIAVAKDPSDEIRALKDTVAQLRAQTKSLNDNLASLKTSVTTTTAMANQQNGKIAETLERIEKAQAEQKKLMASQAAPETTGSINQRRSKQQQQTTPTVPMVLGDPPTTLKPPILQDYVLRRVYDGAALIEGRHGIIEVEARHRGARPRPHRGDQAPGWPLGRGHGARADRSALIRLSLFGKTLSRRERVFCYPCGAGLHGATDALSSDSDPFLRAADRARTGRGAREARNGRVLPGARRAAVARRSCPPRCASPR